MPIKLFKHMPECGNTLPNCCLCILQSWPTQAVDGDEAVCYSSVLERLSYYLPGRPLASLGPAPPGLNELRSTEARVDAIVGLYCSARCVLFMHPPALALRVGTTPATAVHLRKGSLADGKATPACVLAHDDAKRICDTVALCSQHSILQPELPTQCLWSAIASGQL